VLSRGHVSTNLLHLLGVRQDIEQESRGLLFSAAHRLTSHPLNLLGLADRLQTLRATWAFYNLISTNCELFARTLCYSERCGEFSFRENGYVDMRCTQGPREPVLRPLTSHTAQYYLVGIPALIVFLRPLLDGPDEPLNQHRESVMTAMRILFIPCILSYFLSSAMDKVELDWLYAKAQKHCQSPSEPCFEHEQATGLQY
jgi:hypothetical protein